jgi:hypothetical protein
MAPTKRQKNQPAPTPLALYTTHKGSFVLAFTGLASRLAAKGQWRLDQCETLAQELCRGLVAKSLAKEPLELSLPPKLDVLWHELILETRLYQEVCDKLLGGTFLHHTQTTVSDPLAEKHARVERTLNQYRELFSAEPNAWCWEQETAEAPVPAQAPVSSQTPTAAQAPDAPPPQSLILRIQAIDGEMIDFRVKDTTPFKAVFKAYAERKGVHVNAIRFFFDGERILENMTMKYYNMYDNEVIDAMMEIVAC